MTSPARASRVVKKLLPHAPGTQRLTERCGKALVCVRRRVASQAQQRYTTAELIVAAGPPLPTAVYVRGAFEEVELRKRVEAAGGEWCREHTRWRMACSSARRLGLLRRVDRKVAVAD